MVQYAPIPGTGTVYYSMGMVWENPTRGLPILNPTPPVWVIIIFICVIQMFSSSDLKYKVDEKDTYYMD